MMIRNFKDFHSIFKNFKCKLKMDMLDIDVELEDNNFIVEDFSNTYIIDKSLMQIAYVRTTLRCIKDGEKFSYEK